MYEIICIKPKLNYINILMKVLVRDPIVAVVLMKGNMLLSVHGKNTVFI